MNIIILGAGAIGLVFGGLLANAGHRVTLLGREEHMAAVNERGLLIEGIWGNHRVTRVKGYSTIAEIVRQVAEKFDLALVTVKSYDTEGIVGAFHEQFPDTIPLVSLQNGVGNPEKIRRIRGSAPVLAGSVTFGTEITAPGTVRIAVYAEDVWLGGIDSTPDFREVQYIAEVFSAAGIQSRPTRDIYRYLWGKMLYNCSLNGLAAILEVPYGELMEHESSRALISDLVSEMFQVLKGEDQAVNWPDAKAYLQDLFGRLIPLTYNHTPSMLQDLQRRKRTEIDALNGTITERGEKHGLAVPVNWLVTNLVKIREKMVIRPPDLQVF